MAKIPIALQMYTVRDEAAKDFIGAFKQTAEIGYTGVELAGTGGMSAAELKKVLDDLGLAVAGSHVGVEQLESDLNAALDFNEALGNKRVVCPYMPEERRRNGDGWKRTAELFNSVGQACCARGLLFGYHNHSFEFETFDSVAGLDILFGGTDPALVKAEIDTYWVQHGGQVPAEYIRRYADRVELVHLKDMAAADDRGFAEVGTGILDFKAIFAESEKAGAAWYIVEQDVCPGPAFESVKLSFDNLKAMDQG
ncbi:MAG: sugar phosphate isomerase/epimerase [Armatimonadetes bacterium]|nr:sugar phosphate isomerase/epimerase [Armatimonadota bacterium]